MPCALNKQRVCLGRTPLVVAEEKETVEDNKPVVGRPGVGNVGRLKDSGLIATSSELRQKQIRRTQRCRLAIVNAQVFVKRCFSGRRRLSRIPLALLNLLLQWLSASSVRLRAQRCRNVPVPSWCREEHACGCGGTWGQYP
jgi:hypothetical protein